MEKNTKIILGVVAIVLIIVVAAFFVLFTMDKTLEGDGAAVTIPGSFSVDADSGIATNGTISIVMVPQQTSSAKELKYIGAIKSNGKSAGYENITNTTTINGYDVFEYAGHPLKLKNVSTDRVRSGGYERWTTYEPYLPYDLVFSDHFRFVDYIKGEHVSNLFIYTSDPSVDLYSADIDKIINSVYDPANPN